MKNLVLVAVIGFFIACTATKKSSGLTNVGKITSTYMINKIKDEKSFYIIYAVRNDSTFKIISYNSDAQSLGCKNIKVGKSYLLDLKVLFPSDSLFGKPVAPNLGIKGYRINAEKVIIVEKRFHNRIYSALNLSGLCVQ